jgi:hypothetical protein
MILAGSGAPSNFDLTGRDHYCRKCNNEIRLDFLSPRSRMTTFARPRPFLLAKSILRSTANGPEEGIVNEEIDLYGIFVPGLLVWAACAFLSSACIRTVLAGSGFYRIVWHPALFDLALFVVVLAFIVFTAARLHR